MRRGDAALLLAGLAAATLWAALTDAMLRYVRPSMRPWLVASAVLLALLAVAVAVTGRAAPAPAPGPDGDGTPAAPAAPAGHRHGLRLVGWLVALPLVVAAGLDPGALGAYTAARQAGLGPPPADFDLEEHLRTRSFGGQAAGLTLRQLVAAAEGDAAERALLERTPVRLTGFVLDRDGDGFGLARLVMGCCAGDATAVVVDVVGHEGAPVAVDSWLEVVGRFDADATEASDNVRGDGFVAPVVRAESVRPVDEPAAPYEYPG
jgi:uncharacterized repeat protein (TIGR03943 family)